jgi:hypothetical protein
VRRLALAALLVPLAGCGGGGQQPSASTLPTQDVARARLEVWIADDLRRRARDAGSTANVKVHGVRCASVDRTHYVCRIRSSSAYRPAVTEFVADAMYDPRTENASYDVRP